MKTPRPTAAALGLAALIGLGAPSLSAVSVNETVALEGYIGGSYRHLDGDSDFDSFDLDAAKLLFATDFKPVTGVFSLFYAPNGNELTLLDAVVSYTTETGTTISGGKFLSWHGYEAFDIAAMNQLTYGNGDFLGAIPGYHSGVRIEQAGDGWSGGFAVLDSVYTPDYAYLRGDGEIGDNAGFEAYFKYTGTENLTVFVGAAYDTEGGFQPDDVLMLDLWADYLATENLLVAGELMFKDAGVAGKGWAWAGYANYAFQAGWSALFRVSGEYMDDGPSFLRGTIAPTYTLTDNLLVRAELTYTDYSDYVEDNNTFFGVQSIFKF
ncbi:MAG: hypothetical protein D6781_04415 [Verrucomicrobia bacterium]|nr:MAG: hypothetical protein D6781_04415 [Verrucomicrobiota bacterium]